MKFNVMKTIKKTILTLSFALIFTNCTSASLRNASISPGRIQRSIASDDYFSPRDISHSPYRDIRTIDYRKALPGLKSYIQSRPEKVPFQDQETRWAWASSLAQRNRNFFSILPTQGEISNQALLSNTSFLKKMNESKGNQIYSTVRWVMKKPGFATTPPAKLFAYQIFSQSPQSKPSVLIWAKEHGDELATSEFTSQLTEFFLYHLQGRGEQYINKIVQDLFSKLNVIIVPDMTPNKNLKTFEDASNTLEDFNGYGVLLQPFNYDSNNPDDYVLAPEAAFFKRLISGLDGLVLGIDLHTPFGVGVIAGPDDSVAENNRYLIGEASITSGYALKYMNQPNTADDSYLHPKGAFRPTHDQISGSTEVSASYFSRMKVAPSILLELTKGIPDGAQIDSNCKQRHKEESCSYFVKPHLEQYMPYILRLMEIMAATNSSNTQKNQHLQGSFASKEEAKNILMMDGTFFDRLTLLDIQLRMGTSQRIARDDFRVFVGDQSLNWEPQEKERINRILNWIDNRLNSLKLKLNTPAKISFIKTTGKEEGSLPYTRGKSIVLSQYALYAQDLLFTICHELFHIYTKNNPQKRDELYSLIGFRRDTSGFLAGFPSKNKILTNPDVEEINYSISVEHQGKVVEAIPLVLSKVDENNVAGNSSFSSSVDFKIWSSDRKLIDPSETDYDIISGTNTSFNFHPEEILAENFALLLTSDIKKAKHPNAIIGLLKYLKKAE